jgi:hypothetical protein
VPFTLVHPAAVLPMARKPLVVSALVAGALAPDLLYLGPLYRVATSLSGDFTLTLTHSWPAVLWLDPLLAAAMLLLWYGLLRRPLLALAPTAFAGRFGPVPSGRSARVLTWAYVSTVLGAATHVLWDGVTHDGEFAGIPIAALRAEAVGGMSVGRVVQYVSTAVGAAYLLWWAWRWWRRTEPTPRGECLSPRTRWWVAGGLAALVLGSAVVQLVQVGLPGLAETGDAEYPLRSVLVGVASGLAAGIAVYAIGWQGRRLLRR